MNAAAPDVEALADRLAAKVLEWLTDAESPLEKALIAALPVPVTTLDQDRKAIAALLVPILREAGL